MDEEKLRVVAGVVDWSAAEKIMHKVFRNTFVTALNEKFIEFSQTKAAIKDFVNGNFPETFGERTPVRYNPTTKLRGLLQKMRTVGLDEDSDHRIVSRTFPVILIANELQPQPTSISFRSQHDTPPSQLMTSYSTYEHGPIIAKKKTPLDVREPNSKVALSAKMPAQSSHIKYKLCETPLSGGRKGVRFGNVTKSNGDSSNLRPMQEIFAEKQLAASEKRAAYLEERATRIREENEKCFQRVQENLARKSPTPVPYLRPICDAPHVQALRWDEGNVTPNESPNATEVIEKSDATMVIPIVIDIAGDGHLRLEKNEEDLNNNTCISALEDLSEDVLNEAIVNFSDTDGLVDCTQKSSPRCSTDKPEEKEDELFVSACYKTPPCSPIVTSGTPILEPNDLRLKSKMQHQRKLVDEAQIRHHFGLILAPTLKKIFNREEAGVTDENENSNWQGTESYWKNKSSESSDDT